METNDKYLTSLINTKLKIKKYLDRFLFYFYFYFAPSTQIFLKISRKTFYKKKLALYFFCQNSNWDTNLFNLSEETAWCNIMVFVRTKYAATRLSLLLFVKIPLKFFGPANFDTVL